MGRTYDTDEFKPWVSCIRLSQNATTPPMTYTVENVVDVPGGIGYLISTFTLITAIFHLISLLRKIPYEQRLQRSSQPFRWIEYSITYTIMTVCIFQLNGIHGIYETALLVISSVAQMIIGYAIEALRVHSPPEEPEEPKEKEYTYLKMADTSRTKPRLRPLPCWKQINIFFKGISFDSDNLVICLLELVACAIMLVHFICIWHSFYVSFVPYLNSDAGDMWSTLYGYIIVLNIVIYALYSLFPIVHFVVFFNKGVVYPIGTTYELGELGYVALSLTSKLALVAIVTFGAQRNN